jgi:lysozyme
MPDHSPLTTHDSRGLPQEALDLICHFEGYHKKLADGRAAPYLCPARVPTIGVGSTFYEDRRKVSLGDPPITRERAFELLAFELRECEAAVDRMVTRRLHPLSRGALVSFAFNAGAGALKASGLLRRVNSGQWRDVPAEFAKWRMGGGVVLPGLVRRRAAEAALFMAGVAAQRIEPVNDNAAIGAWATRVVRAA